jgi:hypothetical protein
MKVKRKRRESVRGKWRKMFLVGGRYACRIVSAQVLMATGDRCMGYGAVYSHPDRIRLKHR